jgi:hypothetical protein
MTIKVPFTTIAPGNFILPHTLGVIPASAIVNMTSSGSVWFQPTLYDASNLYLEASDPNLTGYIIISTNLSPAIGPVNNSTIKLVEVVEDASTLGDVAPALATGGLSTAPALSIANDVMQAIINGGNIGQPYNWKWNRINIPPFPTISLQQDYYIPGVSNIGWIESAWAVNINQTSVIKQKTFLEVRKDLEVTYAQQTYPGKICWLPNKILMSGTWGAHPLGPTPGNLSGETTVVGPNQSGQQNPGPGVIYTNPLGTLATPLNACTAITDYYGNLWTLTKFGTCGITQPQWPSNPTYPTFKSPNLLATTVLDGSCVWTAIDPNGQGIRVNPVPPQTGVPFLIQVVAQLRAKRFSSLNETLGVIPDDWEWAFKMLFFAECYRRNPDPKVRAKYPQERQLALEALDKSVRQADREMDDFGFYPTSASVMDTGWGYNPTSPILPFGPWTGG